jgi:glycosyltransferase involved in cell wall biosynthesis
MVSVVVPLYQEASHLAESLDRIRSHVAEAGLEYEFVLVDDGSTDGTWDQIQTVLSSFPNLKALRLSRNFGKEAAVSAGIEHAVGDAVIVLDGDLQHPPELIPEMVRLWREERYEIVDVVKEDRASESTLHRGGAALFNFVYSRLSRLDLADASDYKLLSRKAVDAWLSMPESVTFYRGMAQWLGFRRAKLPMRVQQRTGGRSRWSFGQLTLLAVRALTSFSNAPLHLIGLVGFLFILGAVPLGAQLVYRVLTGRYEPGFPTVISLQLLIGGAILFSLWVIGEYIAQIFLEVKRRPRYVVAESVTAKDGSGP